MAFQTMKFGNIAKFNSAISSDFIENYEGFLKEKIEDGYVRPSSKTFAPSSMRCKRLSWFRLRGVQPDKPSRIDYESDFQATVGTLLHRNVQRNLAELYDCDWVSVSDYIRNSNLKLNFKCKLDVGSGETLVECLNLPIRFACDGILRLEGEYYLFEFKTSEHDSFSQLDNPKEMHKDQIKCYCTLLELPNALVVYQDRLYGGLKAYTMKVPDYEMEDILDGMNYVMNCVETNIAPSKLPNGSLECTYCKYVNKCKQWGG